MQAEAVSPGIDACAKAMALLSEVRARRFPPVPDGWFTLMQFCERSGVRVTAGRKAITDLIAAGALHSKQWPMRDSRGRTQYQTIYRPI